MLLLFTVVTVVAACGQAASIRGSTATSSTAPEVPATRASGQAQEYRTMATVLEAGASGPQLCHAVAESYPPQCSGPQIVGWDWEAVEGEESASGVTWVDAVLTGTWDGERFTVTRPVEALSAWPARPSEEPPVRVPPGDPPSPDELYALQDEVSAAVGDGDTPLGPELGSVPDTEHGVVLVQVIAATPEARAWAQDRWGGRVVLDPMLRPVD